MLKNFLSNIQDIKKWESNNLFWWIITYNSNNVALEFFPKWIVTNETINQKIQEFEKMENQLNKILKELQLSELSDIEIDFVQNIIETMFYRIQYLKKSIYFEAEKSGEFFISPEKRKNLLDEINNLQNLVYWWEVSKNPEERKKTLEKLAEKFIRNQKLISDEEKEIMKNFFLNLDFDINNFELKNIKDDKNFLKDIYFKSEDSEKNKEKFEQFIQIIQLVLGLYWLNNYKINIDKNITNFSVKYDEEKINIPEKNIETTSIFRLLQLIDHEIWVHAIRGNNTNNWLKIAGNNYIDAEEWLATHSEMAFTKEIDEIFGEITPAHFSMLIAENYNYKDSKKIFIILEKLNWNKNFEKDWIAKAKRSKRFVSWDLPWANRKDVSYTRGNIEISQKLLNMNNKERKIFLKNFYFSKLSLEDQKFVPYFREIFGDENHKYPIWVGKILFKKLMWEKIFFEEFMKRDSRFIENEIKFNTKRKIIEILKILEENKKNHN